MVRETYSKKEVADFLAENFVALKIDAENGEGPELAKRFGVRAFPTMVLVDAKGEEVDRLVGYRPPVAFIADLKPLLEGKSFAAFKKRVADNPSDFAAVLELGKKYEERDDYSTAEELYNRILKAEEASKILKSRVEGRLVLVRFRQSGTDVSAVQKYFDQHKDTDQALDHGYLLYQNYEFGEDTKKLIPVSEYLLKHGLADNANFLNRYAWYLATHDAELERALELAKKAVDLSPDAASIIDTLAEAYFRNGFLEKAVDTQKNAVKNAPESQRVEFEKRLRTFEKALGERKKTQEI